METKNIYQSMGQIMAMVGTIKKDKTNNTGEGFKYRGIDDVMNALHECFADAGVFMTSEIISRDEQIRKSARGNDLYYVNLKVKYTFHAADGSSISSTIVGNAMDSGDKADNKAMSIALKYCLLQAFLIPTEDMQDPDAESHETVSEAAKSTPVKPRMTEAAWRQAVSRLNAGDNIVAKIKEAFFLTPAQSDILEKYMYDFEKKTLKL